MRPPLREPHHARFLNRVSSHQMQLVNDSRLTDAIDASDALLDSGGGPWNLQMNDHPAPLLEVQSFAGGIGCQQHPAAAAGELTDYRGPLRGGQATVQHAGF